MGDAAEMLLDGTLDYITGEIIDFNSPGFPRTMEDERPFVKKQYKEYSHRGATKGISSFLKNTQEVYAKKYRLTNKEVIKLFSKEFLIGEYNYECSVAFISSNWVKFRKWVVKNNTRIYYN